MRAWGRAACVSITLGAAVAPPCQPHCACCWLFRGGKKLRKDARLEDVYSLGSIIGTGGGHQRDFPMCSIAASTAACSTLTHTRHLPLLLRLLRGAGGHGPGYSASVRLQVNAAAAGRQRVQGGAAGQDGGAA